MRDTNNSPDAGGLSAEERADMRDLPNVPANHSSDAARVPLLPSQQRSFRTLLADIWQHSAWYREYYHSHGIRADHLANLTPSDLPFLTKQSLMEHFDKAVTDPRLRKRDLEHWLQDSHDPAELFAREFIVISSSGSSGSVTLLVYARTAWQLMSATVAPHFPPPERYPSGRTKVAVYLAGHGHFAGATSAAHLPRAIFDVHLLSLLDPAEATAWALQDFQPDRITGYASAVTQLAEWTLEGRVSIRPKTVIVSGDPLTEGMVRTIHEAWGAAVWDLYATSESLYVALKAPGQEEMRVFDDLNIVEVLDEHDRPVPSGGSGRVVLTNLFNRVLPIIRYEMGEYAVRGTGGPDFTTIRALQGRVYEALPVVLGNSQPDSIHPLILASFPVLDLQKVQFISERPNHVRIEYMAGQNIDEAVGQAFQRILAMKGATGTSVTVRRVPHIANDPQTGKLRLVRTERTHA